MLQPGRSFSSDNYRFGYNGKENDNEIKGTGNQQDYGFRIYDPRIAKFLSVDPLTKKFPFYTPYQFAGNKPIAYIDLDGLEDIYYKTKIDNDNSNSAMQVLSQSLVKEDLAKFRDASLNKGFDIVIIENSKSVSSGATAETFTYQNNNGIPSNKHTEQIDPSILKDIESKNRGVCIVFITEKNSIDEATKDAENGSWGKSGVTARLLAHEFSLHAIPDALAGARTNPKEAHQYGYSEPNGRQWPAQDQVLSDDATWSNSPMGLIFSSINKITSGNEGGKFQKDQPDLDFSPTKEPSIPQENYDSN